MCVFVDSHASEFEIQARVAHICPVVTNVLKPYDDPNKHTKQAI